MPRPSRIRRIAKWIGVVACALLGLAWVLSAYAAGGIATTYVSVSVDSGLVDVYAGAAGFDPGWWFLWRGEFEVRWWPAFVRVTRGGGLLRVALWVPFLAFALPTAYLFWRDRRPPPGHCRKCGYDLTGNVSGRCPACGTTCG